MTSDTIGDMLVRIKNASLARQATVLIPHSNLKLTVAEGLKRAGLIGSITKKGKKIKKFLEITLLYPEGRAKISELARVSKPSRRVYHRANQIRPVRQGFGIALYSTSQGVMTDKEARQAKLGGEIMLTAY